MQVPATLLFGFGLMINVADTVTRYDVKPTCRAAISMVAGSQGRTVESCLAGEERARNALEKRLVKDSERGTDSVHGDDV
jgi:hypothetical protein